MISTMVHSIHGTYKIKYHQDGPDGPATEIDFTPPWPRLSMVEEIEKAVGEKIDRDFEKPEVVQHLKDLCAKHKLECPPPQTAARLLDKLCGEFIEDNIVNPAFITEHPQIMSPLAKW